MIEPKEVLTTYLKLLTNLNPNFKISEREEKNIVLECNDPFELMTFARETNCYIPCRRKNKIITFEGASIGNNPLFRPSYTDLFEKDEIEKRKFVILLKYEPTESILQPWSYSCNPDEAVFYFMDYEQYPKFNEDFWGYIAGLVLRKMGYIVTTWKPYIATGDPDLVALKLPQISNILLENNLINKKGFFLSELDLFRLYKSDGKEDRFPISEEIKTVVVEAETDTKSSKSRASGGIKQLICRDDRKIESGFLSCGSYDFAFISVPDRRIDEFQNLQNGVGRQIGLISNDGEKRVYKDSQIFSSEENLSELYNFYCTAYTSKERSRIKRNLLGYYNENNRNILIEEFKEQIKSRIVHLKPLKLIVDFLNLKEDVSPYLFIKNFMNEIKRKSIEECIKFSKS